MLVYVFRVGGFTKGRQPPVVTQKKPSDVMQVKLSDLVCGMRA